MADEEKKPPEEKAPVRPAPLVGTESWTSFSPVDLGVRAAYWEDKPGGLIVFRPIIGWITWNAWNTLIPTDPAQHGLAAMVMNDFYTPVVANFTPKFFGFFPAGMSAEEVQAKIEEWGGPQQNPINTPFTAKA